MLILFMHSLGQNDSNPILYVSMSNSNVSEVLLILSLLIIYMSQFNVYNLSSM